MCKHLYFGRPGTLSVQTSWQATRNHFYRCRGYQSKETAVRVMTAVSLFYVLTKWSFGCGSDQRTTYEAVEEHDDIERLEKPPSQRAYSPRATGQCYCSGMSNGERCSPCCGLSLCRRFFTRICGLSRQSRRLSLPHFGGLSRFFRKRGSSAHQFGLSLCC